MLIISTVREGRRTEKVSRRGRDGIAWVGKMNNIRAIAMEIVDMKIIYA